MELLVLGASDYCVQKVQVVASYAGVGLTVREGVGAEELLRLSPQARSMLLRLEGGGEGIWRSITRS
jgi:hypothetical protein